MQGFGVGGHIPIDGSFFIEFCPRKQHSHLTYLSVFFSFGSVVASMLALVIFSFSCDESANPQNPSPTPINGTGTGASADSNTTGCNDWGWRYLLLVLGLFSLLMLLSRNLVVRLQESPKYLLARNDFQGVLKVLNNLIEINGSSVEITADDVSKMREESGLPTSESLNALLPETNDTEENRLGTGYSGDSGTSADGSRDDDQYQFLDPFRKLFRRDMQKTTILLFIIWTAINLGFTM
ncbi:hypothetical protein HK102_000006 [Quaeritorhiza haematococci]|nr:hypothetical protein HK102_000006 [Quaeritorhiza haematococci]